MAGKPSRPPRFLTVAQVADLLGLSEKTIRRKVDAHELRAHRIGHRLRISEDDYASYVAGQRE